MVVEIDQLPQRRAGNPAAAIGRARVGLRRAGVLPGAKARTLGFEFTALALQRVAPGAEFRLSRRMLYAGFPIAGFERLSHRVVGISRQHPIVQGLQRAFAVETELGQAGAMPGPGLRERRARLFDGAIGQTAALRRVFQFGLAFAPRLLALRQCDFSLPQLTMTALQQRQLFAARSHRVAQCERCGIEVAHRQLDHGGQRQRGQRV